ncbi:autotransporter outer membrane beta-barrel domain-containing protein, partial [Helicobacter brantae]
GLGWIVGRGGTINVSNTLYNYSLDSSLPSKIDLENSTIQAKTLLNRENGEIYLKDKAHIEATTFTSDTNSKVVFIGNGDGFGSITAQNLTLNGDKIYQVQLLKNALKLKYLIATSTNLQGLSDGDINLIDNNGIISDRYQAQIVTEGNDTYIQLTPKDGYVPPTLPTPPTPPTTTPSTPPTTSPSPQSPTTTPNYISNTHSIQTELTKQYLILTTSTLEQTTQTILSQIEQIQALKSISTYALSNLYNRSIQAQIKQPKPLLAYNQPTLYPMPYTQGDYLPPPLIEREKKLSVFANLIGGVFGYDSHLGGNYGINAGADYLLGDSLFLGGYGVLLGKTLQQEGLQMQGFQFELGGYGRYLLSDWEFDTTLSYALLALSTQRAFTLYSQTFSQNASFNTHFFNLEERVGYRFALSDFDTLKPFGGVALHIYSQPSYEESGDFSYTQNAMFYGALGLLAGLEYRKVFQSSSIYLGASFLYQLPIFGDMTYSLQYLDSLLYFKNSQDFIAQVQGGVDFTLTPRSFLSLDLNYRHSLSNYFDVDFMLGYRHLF